MHFLVSHPTPPVFDGPENRNGLRNAAVQRGQGGRVVPKPNIPGYQLTKRLAQLNPPQMTLATTQGVGACDIAAICPHGFVYVVNDVTTASKPAWLNYFNN